MAPKRKKQVAVVTENSIAVQPTTNESVSVESLITQAIQNKVPVETMERLLAMRRELKAEFAKKSFDEAMAAFQAECPTIVKTKEVKTRNGVVAYRYAPIESIVEQVAPMLQKNGFSYSTSMELMPAGVKVMVKVTHRDGHSEVSPMEVPLGNKTDIMSQSQVVAAAQTFAKRYAFCNAFGILTGDEDIDGRTETVTKPTETTKPVFPPSKPVEPIRKEPTDKQKIAYLCKLLKIDLDPFAEDEIKKLTQLEMKEENYQEIIKRMTFLVQERSEQN